MKRSTLLASLPVIIATALLAGCFGVTEMINVQRDQEVFMQRQKLNSKFANNPDTDAWYDARQKLALATGDRVFEKDFARVFDSLALAVASLELTLIALGRYAEAEPVLKNALARRSKSAPMAWQTANTQSLLGAALAGQQRFEEAEPLVVAGYRGVTKARSMIPPIDAWVIDNCGGRVIRLFADQQKQDKVDEWMRIIRVAGD